RHGLDQAAVGPALIEDPAKRRDLHRDIGALDDPRPDGVQDLILRDEVPMAVDQQTEEVECARPDGDRSKGAVFILAQQTAVAPVETEAAESYHISPGMLLHASASLREPDG